MTAYKDMSPAAQAHARAYQDRPEQRAHNRMRHAARREVIAKEGAQAVAGHDIGHVKPLDHGGRNEWNNYEIQTYKKNRGFKRDRNNQPL